MITEEFREILFPEKILSIRFADNVILILQFFAEQQLVKLLKLANRFAIHRKTQGVTGKDVREAWKILYPSVVKINEDGTPLVFKCPNPGKKQQEDKPSENSIKSLAERAGATRKRKSIYPIVYQFLYSLFHLILFHTLLHVSQRKQNTIIFSDIIRAIHLQLHIHFIVPDNIKINKKNKSAEDISPIISFEEDI
jgi:histone H3/H4